jgi:asparagine synthase (glutamine-hydrolysing)
VVERGTDHLQSESALVDKLAKTLSQAVTEQSIADVPIGGFLSGGVDSSTIVAFMQQNARERGASPVRTFTIGFDEAGFDESPYARAVAEHLGTEHHEMRVSSSMAQDVIPTLPWMYDEPFADSSQIPTHLLCKAARERVTVALTGDGGDELFGGYNRYLLGASVWKTLGGLPPSFRMALGLALKTVPVQLWGKVGGLLTSNDSETALLGGRIQRLAERLQNDKGGESAYSGLVSEWSDPSLLVRDLSGGKFEEIIVPLASPMPSFGIEQAPLSTMYRDTMTYLPDDILCKVDRAAMASSLETRVPFLDHRVVEFAWRLPLDMKIRGQTGKWVLRQILCRHVPKELIERPKAGFAIPIGKWLRGPLRDWADDLLNPARLESEGYLRPEPITRVWKEHLSLHFDHTPKIWGVLMFQAWLQEQSKPT